jgi:AAA15 family ATPase/GTPase
MKITKVYLKNFKRFTELEIKEIPVEAKLVVLAGPNGCGKSSVFDAFEQILNRNKGVMSEEDYLRKDKNQQWICEIETNKGSFGNNKTIPSDKNAVYIRSPYRVNPQFNVSQISSMPDSLDDHDRPKRMIDLDQRIVSNYQRFWFNLAKHFYYRSEKDIRKEFEDKLNDILESVLDIKLSDIGNPLEGTGQLYFKKGTVEKFPFKNLSSGEKEVIDMVIDLIVKVEKFNDTIFCIDEPDLHLNTSVQAKLLEEILNLIPDNSQLWIATHSLGFIRKAVEMYRNSNGKNAVILDLSEKDFDQNIEIKPLVPTSVEMRRLFTVALEDLSSMVIPSKIYFCEGKSRYDTSRQSIKRLEFDAEVLNKVFYDQDVIFISSGGKNGVQKAHQLLLKIIKEAGGLREIYSIIDRDDISNEDRSRRMSDDSTLKIWSRREIENYLFDREIIEIYCRQNSLDFSSITAHNNIHDIINDDIKQYQSSIMQQCGFNGSIEEFKLKLAEFITPNTEIYKLLKQDLGL